MVQQGRSSDKKKKKKEVASHVKCTKTEEEYNLPPRDKKLRLVSD